ncbi:MAG: response regulator transcription factor [Blastocatellia bacterium]|nr:response regulator transcription factor [Blastocatellia bacterium]
MTVFITDDSPIVRERLVDMLSELERIEIAGEAGDAQEAIDSIRQLKPDVVILDIQMPGGSGIAVLQHIKRARPAPIVIMFTNYPYPLFRKKCMDEGADFFFDKSTQFDEVIKVLRELI